MGDQGGGSFGPLLRGFRERRRLSQSALARLLGLSPSTVNMLEADQRHPGRETVLALARALELPDAEADSFLVAARHLPTVYDRLSPDDPDLRLVTALLARPDIPEARKQRFRKLIRAAVDLFALDPSATDDRQSAGDDG